MIDKSLNLARRLTQRNEVDLLRKYLIGNACDFIVYSVDVSFIVVLFLIFAIQYHFVSSLYESNTISLNHVEERFTDEGEYSLPLWWDNQFRKLYIFISSSFPSSIHKKQRYQVH